MAEYTIDKFTYGGNTYKLQDNESGYLTAADVPEGAPAICYGVSDTTATSVTKIVTCPGYALTDGQIIGIKFKYANTGTSLSLNINNTGSKTAYRDSLAINNAAYQLWWSANSIVFFQYSGTNNGYFYLGQTTYDETYSFYCTSSTAANTAAKTATCDHYALTKFNRISIYFTNGNTADAPTLNINSTGAKNIRFHNAVASSSNPCKWPANCVVNFIYDGIYYNYIGTSIGGEDNSFGKVSAGGVTAVADSAQDTLTITGTGSVTVTADSSTDTITISGTDIDTKNTVGATNTASQIYLVGTTTQTTCPQSYTNNNLYYDSGLYSEAYANPASSVISQSYSQIQLAVDDATGYESNPGGILTVSQTGISINPVVTPTAAGDAVNKEYVDKRINFSDADDQMWVNWYGEETAIYGQQTQSVTYSFAVHMDDNKTKLTSATLARSYNGTDWDILGTLHPTSSFSNSFVPIGTILDFAGSTAPTGYLICDGSAVSRTTYSDLFAAIGTTWGTGDGSTTFNLPNLCGRTTIGVGTVTDSSSNTATYSIATVSGEIKHTLTSSESGIAEHNHADTLTFKLPNHAHGLANSMIVYNNASSNTSRMATSGSGTKISVNTNVGLNTENPTSLSNCTKSGSVTKHNGADATTSHNNMQPYATVNKIIKAL